MWIPGLDAGCGGAEPRSVGAGADVVQAAGLGCAAWTAVHSRHLLGLNALHDRYQLLLLRLQHGILLPELLLKLGWVCWFHLGQNVLLHLRIGTRCRPGWMQKSLFIQNRVGSQYIRNRRYKIVKQRVANQKL